MVGSPDHNTYTTGDVTSRFYQHAFGEAAIVTTLAISYVGHFKQVQVKITLYCKIPTRVRKFLYMLQRNRINVPSTWKDEAKCNPKLAMPQTCLWLYFCSLGHY